MTPATREALAEIVAKCQALRVTIAALVAQIDLLRAENAQLRRELECKPRS